MATVSDVSAYVLSRCNAQVQIVFEDPTTGDPPSSGTITGFINWAIYSALIARQLGAVVPSAVADSDLAFLDGPATGRLFYDVVLAAKKALLGNLLAFDAAIGPDKQSLSQMATQLEREIALLDAEILRLFGSNPVAAQVAGMTSAQDPGYGGIQDYRAPWRRPEWIFGEQRFP